MTKRKVGMGYNYQRVGRGVLQRDRAARWRLARALTRLSARPAKCSWVWPASTVGSHRMLVRG